MTEAGEAKTASDSPTSPAVPLPSAEVPVPPIETALGCVDAAELMATGKAAAEALAAEKLAAEAAEKRLEEEKREAERLAAEALAAENDTESEGLAEETMGSQQEALGTTGTVPLTPLTPTSAKAPHGVQHTDSAAFTATVRAEVGAVVEGLVAGVEHKEGQEHAAKAMASRAATPVGLVSDEAEVSTGAGGVDVCEGAEVPEEPTVGEEGGDTGRLSPVGSMVVAPPTSRVETAVEPLAPAPAAKPVSLLQRVLGMVMVSRNSSSLSGRGTTVGGGTEKEEEVKEEMCPPDVKVGDIRIGHSV